MQLLAANGTMVQCPQRSNSQNDGVLWQSKLNLVRFVLIALCLIVILQGCRTSQSVRSGIKKESQQAFASRNPKVVSHFGDLELEVRMATTAELPEEYYKAGLYFLPGGAASAGIGVLAASSAMVVGGAIAPLGAYIYLHEKGIWDPIYEALINAEFTPAIDKAMKDRLNITFAKERALDVKIDVIIQSFGLVGYALNTPHCFVVSADFILSRGEMEIRRDLLEISNVNRSKDAPPPQCACLKRFAKNKARLVKDTLAEYAEVLAVMAIDRIPKGYSK